MHHCNVVAKAVGVCKRLGAFLEIMTTMILLQCVTYIVCTIIYVAQTEIQHRNRKKVTKYPITKQITY